MGPRCPYCQQSAFSYRALVAVHPSAHVIPEKIVCPSCHAELRVTAMSRLTGALAFLATMAAVVLFALAADIKSQSWEFVVAILLGFVLYSIVWTLIVRLKPWTPQFQYWLPKSRVVGYSVYLLMPVVMIGVLLYLAWHFRLGM